MPPSDGKEKEKDYKLILNCRDGKLCPTISLVVNRKKLQETAKLAIESAVSQKLSDLLSAELIQKQTSLEAGTECDVNKNQLAKSKYHCQNENPCPTVTSIRNKSKILEEILNQGIDKNSDQKSVPAVTSSTNRKQNWYLENKSSCHIDNDKLLNQWEWNCQEGKPCPAINSLLNQLKKRSDTNVIEMHPSRTNQEPNQNLRNIPTYSETKNKIEKDKSLQNEKQPTAINSILSKNTSQKTVKPNIEIVVNQNKPGPLPDKNSLTKINSKASMSTERQTESNEKDIIQNPSTEIRTTDLSQKPNQYSISLLSNEEYDEENALNKWKKNCQQGIYKLESLVDTCEKNPDSILTTFKVSLGTDRKLPNGSFEIVDEPGQSFLLEKTHGEKFGDPKYHLLMVDASTSICIADLKASKGPDKEGTEISGHGSSVPHKESEMSNKGSVKNEETEVFEEPTKTEVYQAMQEPEEKLMPLTSVPEILISPQSSLQKEKPVSPHAREKKGSILFREDNAVAELDDEEKKKQNKRLSTVSWRAMNTPSDSESTASLEQVVKDATAKAESFRQNLDTKRQHSLLDIVKRRSASEEKKIGGEQEPKPNNSVTKRKKFFSFKCLEKKKQPEKEKEEHHSDSEDDSGEELEEKKPTHSSSMYIDNYRRRNTSFIENPVFEKKKELNQFLNNI